MVGSQRVDTIRLEVPLAIAVIAASDLESFMLAALTDRDDSIGTSIANIETVVLLDPRPPATAIGTIGPRCDTQS